MCIGKRFVIVYINSNHELRFLFPANPFVGEVMAFPDHLPDRACFSRFDYRYKTL